MRYIVTGRVHPERADIFFNISTIEPPTGGSIAIHCEASQLTVILENQDIDGARSAFLMAEHIAQTLVSSLGFARGTGYAVELLQVIEETGAVHVFGTRVQELFFDACDVKFDEARTLCAKDIPFRMALTDYSAALRDSFRCASLCYRSIEAIKSAFAGGSDSEKWVSMHAALGTTRDEIEGAVKAFADPIRHGDWADYRPTNSGQRLLMLQVTRDTLDRYLNWKLSKSG